MKKILFSPTRFFIGKSSGYIVRSTSISEHFNVTGTPEMLFNLFESF